MGGIYDIIETPKIKKECVSIINGKIEKINKDVIEYRKSGMVKDFLITTEDYLYAYFLDHIKFEDDGNIKVRGIINPPFGGMKKFADWIASYTEDGKLVFKNYYSHYYYFMFKDGLASDVVHPDPIGIPVWQREQE